jgi:hypothetical protein
MPVHVRAFLDRIAFGKRNTGHESCHCAQTQRHEGVLVSGGIAP